MAGAYHQTLPIHMLHHVLAVKFFGQLQTKLFVGEFHNAICLCHHRVHSYRVGKDG